jgi:hypothetical protein
VTLIGFSDDRPAPYWGLTSRPIPLRAPQAVCAPCLLVAGMSVQPTTEMGMLLIAAK